MMGKDTMQTKQQENCSHYTNIRKLTVGQKCQTKRNFSNDKTISS